MSQTKRKERQFSLEITTTALCNLGCTYCFEGVKTDKRRLDDKEELVKQRIWELYNSEFFNEKYETLNLSFWGGEPTLNNNFVKNIIKEFQHLPNVDFHLYTNAYNRKRMDDIVDNVDLSKLRVQISYDGFDLSNKFRVTHSGKGSAATVLENMEYFAKKGVNISLKSTVPLTAMDSLYKTWQDFKKLYEKMQQIGPNITVTYAPTIDYVTDLPDKILPDSVATFREQVVKIAKEEIEFFQKNGHFLMTWFGSDDGKVHCASGAHMHAIDVDGKGYACHGSLYSPNKESMQGSDIHSDDFVAGIAKMSKFYTEPLGRISDTCKDCVATACMICPVSSLDHSKAESFIDKWQDRWVNNMCGFYKAFGEIDRTVQAYLLSKKFEETNKYMQVTPLQG